MKGDFFMKRIETKNFVLIQIIAEADGDSTWLVTELCSGKIFYIHVFSNNCLNIKIFNKTNFKKNPSEAISAFCNYLIAETNIVPSINIYYKNEGLIKTCIRAGFIKDKKIKHLYIFKQKRA